jgi:hypothetical protein
LVTRFAKALRVFPRVFAAKCLGLDVIDLNGWRYQAAFRAMTAKGLSIDPLIT